ncbi:putative ABC transport system permease protein [Sporobacter termitidis DSM 10068]|uniref:Putative hemin transport system permease protein HrtB n=1 Tax=Sporobacter termitidis DSM 10068 TaxID=1123282 RepID=A0A1M5VHQ0_9FIRM|nr:ABC transporter permease [Sporobacter termitidis]SHH74708.1 putative ABC transport system permease protein [Sporobacter termitidis DSM 10068]
MKQRPLTTNRISIYNIRRKPFRAACLIIVVAILAFALFGGAILTGSLKNGMNSMQQRLGADLMVVPAGHESDMKGILLGGEPAYFYFSGAVARQVAQVGGVAQATPQFYLSSLSADCCDEAVQLIGFDPGTDFVIQPWIARAYGGAAGDGQLLAGSGIIIRDDGTLKFFNQTYRVAAQLERTSTGLDNSVFMSMDIIKALAAAAHNAGMNFLSDEAPEDAVSAVLVKIDKGYDADAVAAGIRSGVPGVEVIVSQSMISGISGNLGSLVGYINTISAVLWILAVVVLAAVFPFTMNERKKEFAIYRAMGATRKRLIGIVLNEALLASAAGGVLGTAIAAFVVFPFSAYIGSRLNLPYLQPGTGGILGTLALSLLLSFAVGPITSLYAAVKISRAETYMTMREGE